MLTSFATEPDPFLQSVVAFNPDSQPELLEIVAKNITGLGDNIDMGSENFNKYSVLDKIVEHKNTSFKVRDRLRKIIQEVPNNRF